MESGRKGTLFREDRNCSSLKSSENNIEFRIVHRAIEFTKGRLHLQKELKKSQFIYHV